MSRWGKRIAIALTAVMCFTLCPQDVAQAAENGQEMLAEGEVETYEAADLTISSVSDMKVFAANVNSGNTYEGKTVRLAKDLAFNELIPDDLPVIGGSTGTAFKGTFDGAGHTIKNVLQQATVANKNVGGLFFSIGSAGKVLNLTIENYTAITAAGYADIGAITGRNDGKIGNCVVKKATINDSKDKSVETGLGGIAGINDGVIDSCTVTELSATGCYYVGGITGMLLSGGTISNCIVSGEVNGYHNNRTYKSGLAGGIAGYGQGGKMINCANWADISGSWCAGGIVGYVEYNSANLQNCYSTGKATATVSGLLIGRVDSGATVTACYYAMDGAGIAYGSGMTNVQEVKSSAKTASEMKTAGFISLLNSGVNGNASLTPWKSAGSNKYPVHMDVNMISVKESAYGTIEAGYDYTYAGNTVVIDITPATYYKVTGVQVKTAAGGTVQVKASKDGKYSFAMPADAVTIQASYKFSMPIADCNSYLKNTSYTYDGKAKTPAVVVKNGATTLKRDKDYTIKYSKNVNAGKAYVTITGKGSYVGTKNLYFNIAKAKQSVTTAFSSTKKTVGDKSFNVKAKRKSGKGKLVYSSTNKKVATVSKSGAVSVKGPGYAEILVTVQGSSNYAEATKRVGVTVRPPQVVQNVIKAKRYGEMAVSWKPVKGASGYIVEYSRYSSFRDSAMRRISDGKAKSTSFYYLPANKKYYVRVTAYTSAYVKGSWTDIMGVPSKKRLSPKMKR